MERLAHYVIRHRGRIFLAWIALTVFGLFGVSNLADRWQEEFSIPGYSAYEANQAALEKFGTGAQPPLVAVFRSKGDVTRERGIARAVEAGAAVNRGARSSSYFSTGSRAFVSKDRRTTFALIYPAGQQAFEVSDRVKRTRSAIRRAAPAGVTTHLTGRDALYEAEGGNEGPGILLEVLIGGTGALVILLFVFGTLPAVAMPLAIAATSILTTFGLIWALTYVTKVSIIVQFLVALIGLGVAIDYALLMIFRYREELAHGADEEAALVSTMRHAGRSVIVSGSTVAIGLLSMIILPLPFIRSIGIGGMLIPAVSVLAAITLLPALLSKLGHRINSIRVMPKRLHAGEFIEEGFWARWARTVTRRPWLTALIGLAVVVLLLIPASQLNPSEAQLKDMPGKGDAIVGRDLLDTAGFSAGVSKPFMVLVENRTDAGALRTVARELERTPGVVGASAPAGEGWHRGDLALVEAFPASDGASKSIRPVIDDLQDNVLPSLQAQLGGDTSLRLGGVAAEDRDFVHAVYGNFPLVLAFVIILSYLLLARAFRSLLLPLKAVILNLVSLAAAYGIVVFIFQQGHGSEAIWDVAATGAIISWIPLMIFAFLYGLSMDYEVFMLTRMREAYDETGRTDQAVSLGLARTGKLVTSAALVLMFAFFAMSTGPSLDIKQFGIGLAAGIIFDATVIRAVLVPSIMSLLGRWNWWLPAPMARMLFVRPSEPLPETSN
jgi:putative drug exporter of the RND superfamily